MKRNFLTSIMTCIIGSLTLSIAASMASATNWDNRTVIRKERKELRAWDSPRRLRYSPEAQLKTVQSVSRWAAPAIQSEDTEWKTVVEEDFSLFFAGSETEPDMTNILSSEGYLLYDYVHTYGWTGISVYQAGGSAYLVGDGISFLMTPILDLSANNGQFRITFSYRARTGSTTFYIVWGSGSLKIDGRKTTATTDWKTGYIDAEGGIANIAVQFYADADIFIDDIKIEQMGAVEPVVPVEPTLDAPSALAASDITSTGYRGERRQIPGQLDNGRKRGFLRVDYTVVLHGSFIGHAYTRRRRFQSGNRGDRDGACIRTYSRGPRRIYRI